MHRVTAAELADVVAHLDGVSTIKAEYNNFHIPGPDASHDVDLVVRNFMSDTVEVGATVAGPNSNATAGFIENLNKRIAVEIQRQNVAQWTAEPAVPPLNSPKANGSSQRSSFPNADTPRVPKLPKLPKNTKSGFWHTISNHPVPVTIVGGIAVVIIGIWITPYIAKNLPNQVPPTTTTVTITPPSPPSTETTSHPTPSATTTTQFPSTPPTTPATPTATTQPPAATAPTLVTPVPSRTCLAETFMYPPQCIKWSD